MKKVLVIGATGLIGVNVVTYLAQKAVPTVAWVRKKSAKIPPQIEQIEVDFANPPQTDFDVVICTIGTTIKTAGSRERFRAVDFDIPLRVATEYSKIRPQGRFLVVTSVDSKSTSTNFYLSTKGALEDALRSLDLDVGIFQPSLLIGKRSDWRPAEALSQFLSPLMSAVCFGPLKKYTPIAGTSVAKGLVEAALATAPLGGRAHEYQAILDWAHLGQSH